MHYFEILIYWGMHWIALEALAIVLGAQGLSGTSPRIYASIFNQLGMALQANHMIIVL